MTVQPNLCNKSEMAVQPLPCQGNGYVTPTVSGKTEIAVQPLTSHDVARESDMAVQPLLYLRKQKPLCNPNRLGEKGALHHPCCIKEK